MNWKGLKDMNDRTELCVMCGRRYAVHTHHLIMGTANRKLSDRYGLTIRVCDECHNGAVKAEDRIHGNPRAEDLSKMLGQALWERDYYKKLAQGLLNGPDEARDRFREIFQNSYL